MKALLILVFVAAGAFAQDAKPQKSKFMMWFEHLKQGLSESSVQGRYQRGRRVTAVAAVRGSKQDGPDPDKPAWKSGKQAKKAATMKKERAEFAAAVDLIMGGKAPEGVAALEAFEKAHPESPLLPDVKEAKEKAGLMMSEMAAAEKPAADAPKDAEKPAEKPASTEKKD
jgi:hypothetical protein